MFVGEVQVDSARRRKTNLMMHSLCSSSSSSSSSSKENSNSSTSSNTSSSSSNKNSSAVAVAVAVAVSVEAAAAIVAVAGRATVRKRDPLYALALRAHAVIWGRERERDIEREG